jgi:hypothetical protein
MNQTDFEKCAVANFSDLGVLVYYSLWQIGLEMWKTVYGWIPHVILTLLALYVYRKYTNKTKMYAYVTDDDDDDNKEEPHHKHKSRGKRLTDKA